MKQRIRTIISGSIVAAHIILMLWYYSHDASWYEEQKSTASLFFFGWSFIIIGVSMISSSIKESLPMNLEISKFHGVFILLLGTIYALHYSGIMITTSREKLIMIIAGVLTIFIIIFISAWRHGLFNKKTYDL